MRGRVGERDAILVEVAGNGQLAAERVAAPLQVGLVERVVAGLQQYRHLEIGHGDGFYDGDFVAEIGQRHHDAVDRVAVLAEEAGVFVGVLPRLDRAIGRRVERQDAIGNAELFALRHEVGPGIRRIGRIEECPARNDQAKSDFPVEGFHRVPLAPLASRGALIFRQPSGGGAQAQS